MCTYDSGLSPKYVSDSGSTWPESSRTAWLCVRLSMGSSAGSTGVMSWYVAEPVKLKMRIRACSMFGPDRFRIDSALRFDASVSAVWRVSTSSIKTYFEPFNGIPECAGSHSKRSCRVQKRISVRNLRAISCTAASDRVLQWISTCKRWAAGAVYRPSQVSGALVIGLLNPKEGIILYLRGMRQASGW